MFVELDDIIYQTNLELVQIEVTGFCNMHCKHCRASSQPHKMINMEQMKKILKFIKKVKSDDFKLTFSGGEPFLNKNLYKYICMAKDIGLNQIVITTNASMIDDEMLSKLNDLQLKFLCIQISLDSINEEEHDTFRKYPGAFKKCCEVLEKIKNYENLYSSIRMTITSKTMDEIDDMVNFAIEKEVKILGIGSVIPFGEALDGKLSLNSKQKKKFMDKILDLNHKYEGKLEIVTEDPLKFLTLYSRNDVELKEELSDESKFGGCTAGISSININSDGIITPCSMMDEEILDINECLNVEDIISSYENSPVIKNLFSKKYNGKCGNCILKRVCGGCRAVAKAYTGDMMGSDLSCWR